MTTPSTADANEGALSFTLDRGPMLRMSVRSPRVRAVVGIAGLLCAAVAVWVTLDAHFLAYPGWLALQKADLILGPVLIGLYWLRVRPRSRFGWLLVAYGFLCAGYITQSSSRPWLFGTGLVWESLIYLGNLVLLLTFPSGRLQGLVTKLILVAGAGVAAWNVLLVLVLPQTYAGGAISGCRSLCPANGLAVTAAPGLALDLLKPLQISVIAVAVATGALLIWRIATGTPPRRRALAIGTSVALLFLALQITFLMLSVLDVHAPAVSDAAQWGFTIARAAVWYGFLFALIAAQLFAGRVLQRLVRQSVRRPSQPQLEAMLRQPLGDPGFRLRFWNSRTGAWDAPIEPEPGSALTVVEREGGPTVALIHDAQLKDDPELVEAAGAVALMAAENAELDASWSESLDHLRRSRARITQVVHEERRRVAHDLHDGVQQRLATIRLRIATAAKVAADPTVKSRLDRIGRSVEEAIDEIREVAHGLHPHLLSEQGLLVALERAAAPVKIRHNAIGRHSPELETAVYYCCLEALQNAIKHGGPGVTVRVMLHEDADELRFEVSDDGAGFDPSASVDGMGLQNLRERLDAIGGRLSIVSSPGHGTVVSGSIRLPASEAHRQPAPDKLP